MDKRNSMRHEIAKRLEESAQIKIAVAKNKVSEIERMVDFEGFSAMRRELLEPMPSYATYTEHVADAQVRRRGFKIVYAQDSITYTKQPDNLHDFINQRRRNTYLHLQQERKGIPAPHIQLGKVLPVALRSLEPNPRKLLWLSTALTLWGFSYILGWLDYKRKISHLRVWKTIPSAKRLSKSR